MLSFWLAYILTRPLGANIGDWLASLNVSQNPGDPTGLAQGHVHHQPGLPRPDPGGGGLPDGDALGRDRDSRGDPRRTGHQQPAQGAHRAGRRRTAGRRHRGPAGLGARPAARRPGGGGRRHLRRPDGSRPARR
ncbi:hypothetical protein [Streptomyces incarnatus]|uniref:hypothetical protein n=1 Tax=Streptomyces incarnatus TaxID=665007 RepID=UPI001FC9A7FB|nr:hypothetical protein [Streptomyces incarnatus]